MKNQQSLARRSNTSLLVQSLLTSGLMGIIIFFPRMSQIKHKPSLLVGLIVIVLAFGVLNYGVTLYLKKKALRKLQDSNGPQ